MKNVDIELAHHEAETSREEAGLYTELERIELARAEVRRRQDAALALVMEAKGLGADDGGLGTRLAGVKVPEASLEPALSRVRTQRQEALKARKAAHQAAVKHLGSLRQAVADATQAIQREEAAARQVMAQAQAQVQAAQVAEARAQQARSQAARVPPPPPPDAGRPPGLAARGVAPVVAIPASGEAAPGRVLHRVPMQAVIDFHSDDNFFSGFSSNLSDGGIFVATVNLKKIGTEVDLTFSLPTGERIEAHGVVRWVREVNDKQPDVFPGMGVQFTRLDESAHAAIHRFLEQREPLFYAA
jgi:uncharacterized protein (TIGR02266 family)